MQMISHFHFPIKHIVSFISTSLFLPSNHLFFSIPICLMQMISHFPIKHIGTESHISNICVQISTRTDWTHFISFQINKHHKRHKEEATFTLDNHKKAFSLVVKHFTFNKRSKVRFLKCLNQLSISLTVKTLNFDFKNNCSIQLYSLQQQL